MRTSRFAAAALVLAALVAGPAPSAQAPSPAASRQADLEALLAADRGYAAAAASTTLVPALSAMFLPDVIVPGPAGLMRGAATVVAALRAVPENASARVTWTPTGAGVSADGRHGYTYGFMTVRGDHGDETPLKYMAYWVRQAGGWKVAAYKRARRPAGEAPRGLVSARVPDAQAAATDEAVIEAHRRSLAAAEQAFSDRAQVIGLGPAFKEYGAPTAVNMGGPTSPGFVVGADAIGEQIGAGAPGTSSPVHWKSETVLVAPSGDLGISFGYIKAHQPPPGAPADGQPFFTIWARTSPSAPWRYVAE